MQFRPTALLTFFIAALILSPLELPAAAQSPIPAAPVHPPPPAPQPGATTASSSKNGPKDRAKEVPAGGDKRDDTTPMTVVVPLFYFTDAPQVLQILRPDAAPIGSELYQAARLVLQADIEKVTAAKTVLDKLNQPPSQTDSTKSAPSALKASATPANPKTPAKLMSPDDPAPPSDDPAKPTAADPSAADPEKITAAQKKLADALTALETAQHDLATQQAATGKVPAIWTASNTASNDTPFSTVSFRTVGASALYLSGNKSDVQAAETAIHQLDTPVPQMRVTLWTIQVNGVQDLQSQQKLDQQVGQVQARMGLVRDQLAATAVLFQDCIEEQVQNAERDYQHCLIIQPSTSRLTPGFAFYDPGLLDRLRYTNDSAVEHCQENKRPEDYLHPFQVNAQGAVLLDLLLCQDIYRRAALERYLQQAPRLMAAIHKNFLRRSEGLSETQIQNYRIDRQPLDEWYQNNIQMRRLLAAFGYQRISASCSRAAAITEDELKANACQELTELTGGFPGSSLKSQQEYTIGAIRSYLKNLPAQTTPVPKNITENEYQTNAAQMSVGDQIVRRFVEAAEEDLDEEIIQPNLHALRTAASNRALDLSSIQSTSVLAADRHIATVFPTAHIQFSFPPPVNLVQQSLDLAKALAKGPGFGTVGTILDRLAALNGSSPASTPPTSSSPSTTTAITNPASSGAVGGSGTSSTGPPDIYQVNTGNSFTLTPFLLPDAQNMGFQLDYTLQTPVVLPTNASAGRTIAKIEQHQVSAYVQDDTFQLRELSRFDSTTHLSQPVLRSGGIPLLNQLPILRDIPLIGYFSKTSGSASGQQSSLIFVHTVQYPTVQSLLSLF